jgi:hypothetical protein
MIMWLAATHHRGLYLKFRHAARCALLAGVIPRAAPGRVGPRLQSDRFKITSNILRRNPRLALGDLGQIAGRSGRPTDEFGELFFRGARIR